MKNPKYRFYFIALGLIAAATVLLLIAMGGKGLRENAVLPVKAMESLPSFRIGDIAEVEMQWGPRSLKLAPENGVWKVRTPGRPVVIADPAKITALLDELARTKLMRELQIDSIKDAEALALGDYQKDRTGDVWIYYGCRFILRDHNRKEVLNLMLGIAHYRISEQFGRYSATIPDGRYARIESNGTAHYFLISRVLDECMPLSSLWVNPLKCYVSDTPDLIRYSDTTGKTRWEVRRNGQQHTLAVPAEKKLDVRNLQEKIGFLFQAPLSRDIAPESVDFKPETKLEIQFQNGFSYTLEMQNGFDELERYGRLTPAYDPAKTARFANETDEAYEKRKTQYAREQERENRLFGGLVFILRPNLISIFESVPAK